MTVALKRQPIVGAPKQPWSGTFITFEGIEGCGKTTQCSRLAKLLRAEGHQVIETREPGGTPFAERIRRLFLTAPADPSTRESITPQCEATLILACRSQHVTHVITPALQQGAIVLCDRFSDSTLAYQGYGRGLEVKALQVYNHLATGGLEPDLTLLFDLPVNQGLSRRHQARHQNRLDREAQVFHERVRKGFLALAGRHSRRMTIIDGRQTPEAIAAQVAIQVKKALKKKTEGPRKRS